MTVMQEIEETIKYHEELKKQVKETGLNNDYDVPVWVKQLADFKNRCKGDPAVRGISFYRARKDGKEFVYYHRDIVGKNHVGNKLTAYQPATGTQDVADIEYSFTEDGARKPTSISFGTEYLIPFTKATAEKLIKEGTIDEPNFYVKDSAFTFAVDQDTFLTGKYEDIVADGRRLVVKRKKTEASDASE